jgi:hypothetical protein
MSVPGGQVVSALIDQFVGSADTNTAVSGGRRAHQIVTACVHTQHSNTQPEQAVGKGVEQRGTVKTAASAVDEDDSVEVSPARG